GPIIRPPPPVFRGGWLLRGEGDRSPRYGGTHGRQARPWRRLAGIRHAELPLFFVANSDQHVLSFEKRGRAGWRPRWRRPRRVTRAGGREGVYPPVTRTTAQPPSTERGEPCIPAGVRHAELPLFLVATTARHVVGLFGG